MTGDGRSAAGDAYIEIGVGAVLLGVPLSDVREVLRAPPITRVPEVPAAIRGVASVRGEIVPVVDLAARLGEAATETGGRLLVVRTAGFAEPVGLLVDRVLRVVEADGPIEEGPEEARSSLPRGFLAGIAEAEGGETIAVLDLDAVLDLNGEGR